LAENLHLGLHTLVIRSPATVGSFAGHAQAELFQLGSNTVPAAAAVGIDLVENSNLLAANADEVLDEAGRLLVVGGPEIKDELVVRRLSLRLGAAEGKKEINRTILVALQQRQDPRYRGAAHVVE